MRPLPALAAACLIAAPALARHHTTVHASRGGATCTQAEDRTAFEVEALKSELMVTALKCNAHAQYNAFMTEYRPEIARQEGDLHGYFKRAYGRTAQTEYDEYISNLANAQEQDGLKAGTAFCDALPQMFDEVMSLQSAAELPDYAQSQPLVQPATFAECSNVPVARTVTTRHSRHHIRTKHT